MAVGMGTAMVVMTGLQLGTQLFGFLRSRSKKKKILKQVRQQRLANAMTYKKLVAEFQVTNRGRSSGINNMFLRPSGINMRGMGQMGGYGPAASGFYPPSMGGSY